MSSKRPKNKAEPKVKKKRPLFRGEPCALGQRILTALVRLGWTATDLAQAISVSRIAVGFWIAGTHEPSFVMRERLRSVLGAGVC